MSYTQGRGYRQYTAWEAQILLQARMQETVDKLALEDQEQYQQWSNHNYCAGCDQRPLRPDLAQLGKYCQTDRQWAAVGAIGHYEGPQKIIPVKTDRR